MHSNQRYARLQLLAWKILELQHIDPLMVFLRVGLDPKEMYGEGSYHIASIRNLWDEMSKVIANPSYGLKASLCWHPSILGSLGYSLISAPSLRSTFERFIKFYPFISNSRDSHCTLNEDSSAKTLTFSFPNEDSRRPGTFGRQDANIAGMMSILRTNFVGDLSPIHIGFRHEEPTRPGDYFSTLKGPVHFNQPQTSITIRLVDADFVLPLSPKEMQKATELELKNHILQKKGLSLAYRIGLLIDTHIDKDVSIEFISKTLNISTKSLQRLLKKEGTSYTEILERRRLELAKKYLEEPDKPISEISFLLGYSEQSAFSRSFKNMTGISPTEYREMKCVNSSLV